MNNPTIETDIAQLLNKLDGRFDKVDESFNKISDRLTQIEVGQARLEEKVSNLDKEATEVKDSIKEIKDTQKTLTSDISDLKGVKSLIVPIIVAVTTSILTLILRTIPNP